MPTDDASASSDPNESTGRLPDVSLRIDESALSEEEREFARLMGFGAANPSGPAEGSSDRPQKERRRKRDARSVPSPAPPVANAAEEQHDAPTDPDAAEEQHDAPTDPDAAEEQDDDPTDADAAEEQDDAPDAVADTPGAANDARVETPVCDDDAGLEPIHPRPAALGIQDEIQDRAKDLMQLPTPAAPTTDAPPTPDPAAPSASPSPASGIEALTDLQRRLEEQRAEHDKRCEALESDVERLVAERDRLVEDIVARDAELSKARARIAELGALSRAMRGGEPLPEGERALRAEVVGLRERLARAGEEHTRLASDLDARETELSIARARVEDLQLELEARRAEEEDLRAAVAEHTRLKNEAEARAEDSLELCGRLQSESRELRGIQVALEETLSARDQEVEARGEHLDVLRAGLSARDTQIERLERELAGERERSGHLQQTIEQEQREQERLRQEIQQRDARIAALEAMHARIGEMLGAGRTAASAPDEAGGANDADQ